MQCLLFVLSELGVTISDQRPVLILSYPIVAAEWSWWCIVSAVLLTLCISTSASWILRWHGLIHFNYSFLVFALFLFTVLQSPQHGGLEEYLHSRLRYQANAVCKPHPHHVYETLRSITAETLK